MALTLAIGFLVDDAIVFLENTVRLMEEGRNAFEASLESAKEISFTIMAMTLSLAAVFIPLVFMSGLMGRIFREFSITIVISILASGLVSLTLTPLMTSRLLSNRGEGAKKTWMERVFGAVEHRVLDVYGRSLWFFLRHRWISAVTWVVCLAGTAYFFYVVPKSFLPVGDSSFIRGVMVAQEGSSPDQMHAYQTQAEKIMKANPAVRSTFTMSGNAHVSWIESDISDCVPEGPVAAAADHSSGRTAHGRNQRLDSRRAWRSSSPIRCWRSAPARRPMRRGNSPMLCPGSIPTRCTTYGRQDDGEDARVSRIPVRELRSLQPHSESASRHSARPGEAVRRVRDPDSHASARRLLAELQLPDQEADRSVPGDSGSGGRPALRSRGPGQALHQERRRPAHGSSDCGHELASGHRPAGSQPHQSIHQRDHVLQFEARLRDRPGDSVRGSSPPSRFCRQAFRELCRAKP